jgi:5-methylcytosine-specific restriction protein A|nr:MAG TPA: HNH endonuclease bacteriophage, HNH Endonuclease, DNA.52A [Caudoviricetes sp.]DAU37721.1 MAG TPA: HNH endonuclease bacteriophage, HNH Endonuclease, DNA.52A [Caudoviricetes sp.]DAV61087.1 MAG TPA: HNH endonuclease bacteriophage, HNH Endonuclease, DNA.52A [Caudoviricetes sp.]
MAWETSDRAARLPDDWEERRAFVRDRAAGRCEAMLHDGTRCPAAGTDCDHIEPGDDHRAVNLQWLCRWHHKRKTQQEAAAALAAERKKNQPRKRKHPGLID